MVTVSAPSIENTNAMMSHPKIRMLVATGGPAIVKTVLSSGKKAIGAGAGNPPVVVDETADIEKAAKDIVDGCSFDNNLPCIAEKEVIAVDSVADYLISVSYTHLDRADMDALFGPGSELTVKKMLGQPGQYASEETVTIRGPKGELSRCLLYTSGKESDSYEVKTF